MENNPEFHPTRSRYFVLTSQVLYPLLIILITIFSWWFFFASSFFSLSHFECILDFEPCQNQNIIAEVSKYRGKNIFLFNGDKLKSRLMSADYTIRTVTLTKHLPNSLSVSMESVYPVVAAKVIGGKTWVIFDDQNRVIGVREQDPNVPFIIVKEIAGIVIGEKLKTTEINEALILAKDLSRELAQIKSIELDGENLNLTLEDGKHVIMTTAKDEHPQIQSLQAVLSNATILTGVSTIDVRFAQPVLRP